MKRSPTLTGERGPLISLSHRCARGSNKNIFARTHESLASFTLAKSLGRSHTESHRCAHIGRLGARPNQPAHRNANARLKHIYSLCDMLLCIYSLDLGDPSILYLYLILRMCRQWLAMATRQAWRHAPDDIVYKFVPESWCAHILRPVHVRNINLPHQPKNNNKNNQRRASLFARRRL